MRVHRFEQKQFFKEPLRAVFPFFADATNLERITPPFMKFEILTPRPIPMRAGQRIEYALKIRGIPVRWISEITVWDPPNRFVDEQVKGPYRKWSHEHRFWEADGGTWMEDQIDYAVLGGELIRKLLVEPDLRRIFEYRSQVLESLREREFADRAQEY